MRKSKDERTLALLFSLITLIYFANEYYQTNHPIYLLVVGFFIATTIVALHKYREICAIEKKQKRKQYRIKVVKPPKKKKYFVKQKTVEEPKSKYHDQYQAMWDELNK